jgi:uncharacterized protein (TIGR03435 family)
MQWCTVFLDRHSGHHDHRVWLPVDRVSDFWRPNWLYGYSHAYEVDAKSDQLNTEKQCRQLVQSLLEDRFRLRAHREVKEMPVFALTVSDNSPKLREIHPQKSALEDGVTSLRQASSASDPADGWSMPTLAGFLSEFPTVGRPVIDRTGLTSIYSLSLEFANSADGSSIFTRLTDQLGLKLEATKAPVAVLVIDHIERPTEN